MEKRRALGPRPLGYGKASLLAAAARRGVNRNRRLIASHQALFPPRRVYPKPPFIGHNGVDTSENRTFRVAQRLGSDTEAYKSHTAA
jgi:hypothetical protein